MTNNPAAKLKKTTKVEKSLETSLPKLCDRDRIMEDPEFYKMRNYILDYLYNRFAHDDE